MIAAYEHSWVACARLLVSTDNENSRRAEKKRAGEKRREKRKEKSFDFLVFPQVVAHFFLIRFLLLFTCYARPLQAKLNLVKAQEMDSN